MWCVCNESGGKRLKKRTKKKTAIKEPKKKNQNKKNCNIKKRTKKRKTTMSLVSLLNYLRLSPVTPRLAPP
jgi:hypothetical protein